MSTSSTESIVSNPHTEDNEHLSLSQAARMAPGQPTPNCIWRWCRRGVKARTGERIRLEHVRIGGKLFTTRRWINEFGKHLAEADRAYFDIDEEVSDHPARPSGHQPAPGGRRRSSLPANDQRLARRRRIEEELEAEGL